MMENFHGFFPKIVIIRNPDNIQTMLCTNYKILLVKNKNVLLYQALMRK